jgi:glycosyltransferase involved in cell wall biosynthesis
VPSSFQHITEAEYGWILDVYNTRHRHIDRFLTNYPNELRQVGVPAAKIMRIHAVADIGRVRAMACARGDYSEPLRAQMGVAPTGLVGLTVGRLHPSKGHRWGLQALPAILERYPGFHWVIVGDGEERPALEQMAVRLGVTGRVHFVGFLEDPLPWYFASDIYLRTHIVEGDNLSSVQAMAASLPVAGFDTGSEAEMIREVGHGLLAPNRNADAFARVVIELIGSEDRKRRGELGERFASANLDIGRIIERCQETYEELAEHGRELAATA